MNFEFILKRSIRYDNNDVDINERRLAHTKILFCQCERESELVQLIITVNAVTNRNTNSYL